MTTTDWLGQQNSELTEPLSPEQPVQEPEQLKGLDVLKSFETQGPQSENESQSFLTMPSEPTALGLHNLLPSVDGIAEACPHTPKLFLTQLSTPSAPVTPSLRRRRRTPETPHSDMDVLLSPRRRSPKACRRCQVMHKACDSNWPRCNNCRRAHAECIRTSGLDMDEVHRSYIDVLERRCERLQRTLDWVLSAPKPEAPLCMDCQISRFAPRVS